jgi:hypothetical protein
MLIWNGREWAQFQGSRVVSQRGTGTHLEPCVKNEPLGNHDTYTRAGEKFRPVLQAFLNDPDSSYVGGNGSMWRMRLAAASGGVL